MSRFAKPHLVFWEASKYPCGVVQTQYHNARSKKITTFSSHCGETQKDGEKEALSANDSVFQLPIVMLSEKMVDERCYCTVKLVLCYDTEVCL